MKKINIGIIGLGTVGSQVYKILSSKKNRFRKNFGINLEIKKICDKNIKKISSDLKNSSKFTRNYKDIIKDSDIDIVIELIGGIEPAKSIIRSSLEEKKHVITANKALLAEYPELFELAIKNNRLIKFEASVGAGIPVIRTIQESLAADKIFNINGIVNGTSNYILTNMEEAKCDFKQVLKMAQKKGYAEKDPTLDIEGIDSVHKLAILANISFGLKLKPNDIYSEGITHIEYSDIQYAKESGYKIKLLAIGKRKKNEVELRVHPTLISEDNLLSSVRGVYNAVYIESDLNGKTLLYGRGAGGKPTANAIVSDALNIAKNLEDKSIESCHYRLINKDINQKNIKDIVTRYYLRLMVIDRPGVLANISDILGKCDISISSVMQKERRKSKVVPLVMMTHEAKEFNIQKALKKLERLNNIIKNKPVVIRIEDRERN